MAPVTVPLPPHYAGDTWQGITIGPVTINGAAPASPADRVRMHFRDSSGALGYGFDSDVVAGMGLITILNATNWHAQIYPQPLPLTAGTWEWDIEIIRIDGQIFSPYDGELKVKGDITHD